MRTRTGFLIFDPGSVLAVLPRAGGRGRAVPPPAGCRGGAAAFFVVAPPGQGQPAAAQACVALAERRGGAVAAAVARRRRELARAVTPGEETIPNLGSRSFFSARIR